jgi:hypothetical protein
MIASRRELVLEPQTCGADLPFDPDLICFTQLTRLELAGPWCDHLLHCYQHPFSDVDTGEMAGGMLVLDLALSQIFVLSCT